MTISFEEHTLPIQPAGLPTSPTVTLPNKLRLEFCKSLGDVGHRNSEGRGRLGLSLIIANAGVQVF